jgi:phosphatidyl-myo-inositol dimannoside synthase
MRHRGAAMKILALITDGFGADGGIGEYNRNLMTALCESPRVSRVIALPRFGKTTPGLPDKLTQWASASGRAMWSLRTTRLALSQRYDAIFCGHLNAAPLAAALALATRTQLWLQVHGIEAWLPPGIAIRKAVGQAELITSVSRYTRARLLAWADVEATRVRVLPNTVSPTMRKTERRADLVNRYSLANKQVILTIGRMASAERYKGHDTIIRALPAIAARVPSVAYLIGGTGDDRPRLQALANEQGIGDRVIFTGRIPDAEMPDYFALADVFAMPSSGEGFGIVFLEAMAAGLPVIAGNSDGSVDALGDGALGVLINPDDSGALAAAIVSALKGDANADPARGERFDFPHFATQLEAILGHHLSRGDRSTATRPQTISAMRLGSRGHGSA